MYVEIGLQTDSSNPIRHLGLETLTCRIVLRFFRHALARFRRPRTGVLNTLVQPLHVYYIGMTRRELTNK